MTGRRLPPHTLAGPFAMDALDPASERRFARHLTRCRECDSEVTELREVAGRLAMASAAPPPDVIKGSVLRVTKRIRQLPPVVDGSNGGRRGPKTLSVRPARAPRLAIALTAAAVVAAAAIWLSGHASGHSPASQLADPAITAVLTAPDATMIDAAVRPSGSATVVMSLHKRRLVFAAAGLRALPAHRCYELWLVGHGRDRPAGLLPMPRHGMTGPVVAAGLHAGDRLGLSVEPAAGSRHPTSRMILLITL
ncbi:MAG TPA: anti-sigma factor [Streptosporangiaceae bacterium]|nr:anti-sigma factor [Streptosporangiaceae bacterium]